MLLCNKQVGETDFSEYTSVFIPYCTQDIHFGDNKETSYGVQHVGAHNIFGTLQWIFENFPNPESIFITGCSAGATPLPVLYDLINAHYNQGGDSSVNIDVVADSSVFLTPISFMKNYLSTWNIGTILDRIDFDFEAYRFNESFPYEVLDHVLERSKKTDDIGYVSHDADGISLYYYKIMSEGISGLFGRDRELSSAEQDMYKMSKVTPPHRRRKMNDEESDPVLIKWWEQMNNSMNLAESTHINFDSFVMEGDGHCSFGLNVPLEYEGFEDWLANLLDGDKTEVDNPTTESTSKGTTLTTSNADISPTTNASMVDTTPIGSEANDISAAGQVSSSFSILLMCFLLSWKLLISHK